MKVVVLRTALITILLQETLGKVTLSPSGDVRVCKGDDQQFMCSSSFVAFWGISGFGSGISDTNSPVSALSYASSNDRVETSDVSLLSNPSTLTFHNLGYADHNAVVTCLNATLMGAMTSTIRIGPPVCDVVLIPESTSSTITVTWTVSLCEGALPMSFEVQWNSTDSAGRGSSGHLASAATSHVIEGLRNGTVYDISLTLSDDCGTGSILIRNVSTLPQALVPPASSTTDAPIPHCEPATSITAGVAVGCLALSLVFTAVSVVITFLCTRRCYKKSSPPSPNEKSVHYETAQSDSVQMQPSPAYESVEKVK